MMLTIEWTRTALALPGSVRKELSSRLNRLHRYFPEMRPRVKVGITHSYDGLASQSDEGSVKLMIAVRRMRSGACKYPTYWTLAHELMHLAQFNAKAIPGTERATDIYALARLPPEFIDEYPSYLVAPKGPRKRWTREHAKIAHELALEALKQRSNGLRRYARWWEDEFERVTEGKAASSRAPSEGSQALVSQTHLKDPATVDHGFMVRSHRHPRREAMK
jgi:hypothetical protein